MCKCITQLISLFHILNIVENPKKERKEIERVAADKHKRENPSEGKKWQKTEILTGFILFKVTYLEKENSFNLKKLIFQFTPRWLNFTRATGAS